MITFLLLALAASAVNANDEASRRFLSGMKLFPAVVAADQELSEKLAPDGRLPIVVLYRKNAEIAAAVAKRFNDAERIKDIPVRAVILPLARLAELEKEPPAALFIAEWSPDDLANTVRFGITHHRIVYSPFKGDVEAGALGGVYISDLILPFVNRKTVKAAGIRLNPFLLEVAKVYE